MCRTVIRALVDKKGPKIMDVLLGLTFTQDNEGEIDRDFKFQLKGQY